jgi:N-acetylglucosamine kinase-like BadF-type ATPase
MIVIVDMGATKTDWSFADGSTVIKTIQSKGFNPYFYSTGEIVDLLKADFIEEDFSEVKKVYLYGAGCSTQEKKNIVQNALKVYFPFAKIEINHDLLASARAICGKNPGIACILGTGSNSCLYDGTDVIANNPSLGFILGDEGSGGDLGRELIKAYYYGELSTSIEIKFEAQFNTDRESLLTNIFSTDKPNTYCAAFAPFLAQNIDEDCINKLVVGSFNQFFERHVSTYDNYKKLPINFVGSVAHHFKYVLEEVAKNHGCRIGLIVKAPVGKLIEYHYKYDV